VFKSIGFSLEAKGEFKCSWDEDNKGIIIDIEKDRTE